MTTSVSGEGGAGRRAVEATTFSIILALGFSHFLNDMIQSLVPALYPMLKDAYGLSFMQIGLITLVAGLNILITLIMMTMEKYRDIAILLDDWLDGLGQTPDEVFEFCDRAAKLPRQVPIVAVPSSYEQVTEAELADYLERAERDYAAWRETQLGELRIWLTRGGERLCPRDERLLDPGTAA